MKLIEMNSSCQNPDVPEVAGVFMENLKDYKGFVCVALDPKKQAPELYLAGLTPMEQIYLGKALEAYFINTFHKVD